MSLQFAPMQEYLWNPSQWQGSRKVQKMNWAERGLYRELMDECYLHGSIPGDVEGLAEMLGEESEVIAVLWPRVSRCFEPDPEEPGRVISTFIEEVRVAQDAKRKVRAESGRIGNQKRWGEHSKDRKCDEIDRKCDNNYRDANENVANDREEGGRERVKEVPPLAPKGATAEPASQGKPKRAPRKPLQSEDCRPDVLPHVQAVYKLVPKIHPVSGEEVHKGPFAAAARAIQRLVDDQALTPLEAEWVGKVYYTAEDLELEYPEAMRGLVQAVSNAWDWRPKAMMQVSTLFGPEKKPWAQLLPVARKAMARVPVLLEVSA